MRSMTPRSCSSLGNATFDHLELAGPLDVDLIGPVHHDFGDAVVREQVLERSEAERLVEHFLDDLPAHVARRDRAAFLVEQDEHLGFGARPDFLQLDGIPR